MIKKREIGLRIKEFGERNFTSMAEFSRQLGMKTRQELYTYIHGRSIPGGDLLSKMSELGCDINWLLTGKEPAASQVKEPSLSYSAAIDERFKKLEERINHLEEINTKWMQFSAMVLEQYKKDCGGKDETIARLSVQFISLVAANHAADKLDCGNTNINKE